MLTFGQFCSGANLHAHILQVLAPIMLTKLFYLTRHPLKNSSLESHASSGTHDHRNAIALHVVIPNRDNTLVGYPSVLVIEKKCRWIR